MTQTGLVIEIETTSGAVAITAESLQPVNSAKVGRPWTSLVLDEESITQPTGEADEMTVTALWGWSAVPSAIKQATLLQTNRLFVRRNAPFGVAGSPEMGSELRLLEKVDADVAVVLGPYVRWWSAA
jgi:hypothetical protein